MSKTIEETYKKLSQREHVLQRPGMYIGNVKKQVEEQWVFDNTSKKMIKKFIEFSPGFLKIFDEILSNATDHAARDPTVTTIKVDMDTKTGEISVWNNGKGVPVVLHKEHNMYVPELIFGHLLSGSNYNDNDQRTGAGTNGLGAKACSIFSKKFVVETLDSDVGLKFIQEHADNMTTKTKPKITKNSGKSYTKITFIPDYSKFSMKGLEPDTIMLLNKRVYDCIACTNKNVSIYYNGEKLKGKGLTDYIKYFFDETSEETPKIYYDTVTSNNLTWEWAVLPWEKFEHVSFVNGTSTYVGGKHVDHIMYQITAKLKTMLETKKKLKDVKPSVIKERMFLFLCATVVNPHFNSQTKECLTTQSKDFGLKVEVSEKFINNLWKSSIIEEIVEFSKMKESMDLAKSTNGSKKTKVFIPKLEDAIWAGTARSNQCTLILTEGDSAKTFAMWGRSIIGNEKFGVMPLRGKLLNIRDASNSQILNNEELNNLKQILGLKHGKEYKDVSDLRYGKVMLLTDADVDATHITCLVINFFHYFWPSLLKLDFLQTLRTPIVKAIKGKKVIEFYTEQDYNAWKQSTNTNGFNIRYFKGLGTSKRDDAKDTFSKFNDLKVDYYYQDAKCDQSILLAFDKDKNAKKGEGEVVKCSDQRKKWLQGYDKNVYIDAKEQRISFADLIHKELIHFSIYDNTRSIPSMCDGLKPSQRKILYYVLSKNITKEIKVAQLSGYVSAETSYHHGEASLQGAIINMAQDFVGSNNINLLYPDSNFGSRWACGKDAASPRYIFTKLSPITPLIFHPDDTALLNFLNDDGQPIEPEFYVPVIPMILVNGCEGIGTGYSTYIPPYNPKEIISNLFRVMDDQQPLPMTPYFKGFCGKVTDLGGGSYITEGRWERLSDTQIKITEIPVGTGVTPYKEFLESLIEGQTTKSSKGKEADSRKTEKKNVLLKDVKNTTTDENHGITFIVDFKNKTDLQVLIDSGTLTKELKLTKSFSINNMYLFDDNSIPVKYADPTDILLDFYDIRLEFYTKRREHLIQKLAYELSVLQNKIRFIEEYIGEKLDINRKTKDYIVGVLERAGYMKVGDSFDYLTNMPMISLTDERIKELQRNEENKRNALEKLQRQTEIDLWKEDLQAIVKLL